ncbi:MAG: L-lactate dehydrogenase [Pirellulales bacterium]|nr:L-lactate dehydrogenase [Pirellulales bacterium]
MKIGIVGSGFVGATAAYALVMRGVGREIVLVDKALPRAEAEADDILHAVPFAHPLEVRAGDFPDLKGSQLVILAAGVGQQPGESRLALLARNAAVFSDIVPKILRYAPEAVLVVATNPVDVMTHVAATLAERLGLPRSRVLGSGTTLDTARFRAMLGQHLGIDAHHVHAYVLGEHGDTEVLTWSLVNVGGLPLDHFAATTGICLSEEVRQRIDHEVRDAAQMIIAGKGATYYGVASALARIASAVLGDQRAMLTVSSQTDAIAGVEQVTLSLPRLVGGAGVLTEFPPPLNADEERALQHSARTIRDATDSLSGAF